MASNRASNGAPVVITGAALGLPGTEHIFDDGNIARILRGDQFIDSIPARFRRAMLDKHITRLVKSENGDATFETITDVADVIKLAGRGGAFDLEDEFGISAERVGALDRVTQLAIAAGIDALRDAGIPLVMRYKTTTKGTQLPERWGLPDSHARRYRRDLCFRLPRVRLLRGRDVALLRRPRSPRAVGHARKPARSRSREQRSFC